MIALYHLDGRFVVTRDRLWAFALQYEKIPKNTIVIDGKIFGHNGHYKIPCDITCDITVDNDVYDTKKWEKIWGTTHDKCICSYDVINLYWEQNAYIMDHIRKLEKKYNRLADKSYRNHIEPLHYDKYQSASVFKFTSANDKSLFYMILCVCIRAGLWITHNEVVIKDKKKTKIGPQPEGLRYTYCYRSTTSILTNNYMQPSADPHPESYPDPDDTLFELYHRSKKGKWLQLTGTFDSLNEEFTKSRLKDYTYDCRILVSS
jgi:hypothetical protein